MDAPKVSVLIPTYNYARFLPQAIESVLNQSFRDFELIIGDDNSTDSSAEVIRTFAAQDARIRFSIHERNLGMVENWNWCLAQAKGVYVKYLFGDDFLLATDALERLVQLVESKPGIDLAASARTVVDDNSSPVQVWDDMEEDGILKGEKVAFDCLKTYRNLIGEPSVVLFRREKAQRGFDTSFRQAVDLELWLHLLHQGGDVAYTRIPLCAFRRHSLQQTALNHQRFDYFVGEHDRILLRYSECYFRNARAKQLFEHLYWMRKKPRGRPDEPQIRNMIADRLGGKYYLCWLQMRFTKLGINVRRAWRKHVLRQPIPSKRDASEFTAHR
jgi:glycosyltransferase involved in cell wall biosynthesis